MDQTRRGTSKVLGRHEGVSSQVGRDWDIGVLSFSRVAGFSFGAKVKFNDIKADDPRWTEREQTVLHHLFRQRDLYVENKRLFEAHGVNKSIWIIGNILDSFSDAPPTDFNPMI